MEYEQKIQLDRIELKMDVLLRKLAPESLEPEQKEEKKNAK